MNFSLFQSIPVNGEVDSQLLNKVFLGARAKTGLKFIAGLIGEKPIPYHDESRNPKLLDFGSGKFGKPLSPEALVHAVQDCRLPLAGIGIIMERYCHAFRIHDQHNILPMIHHILTRYLFFFLKMLLLQTVDKIKIAATTSITA